MVTGIVLGITIPLAAVVCTFLFTHFGVKVNYNKTFTIKDERVQLTPEALQKLENNLNAQTEARPTSVKEDNTDKDFAGGPMGSVIAEIQDLFGPDGVKE